LKWTPETYAQLMQSKIPASPLWKDMLFAFVIGGGICTLGQAILNGYLTLGLDEKQAGTALSITLIFLSALLTGLGLYDKLAKYAGAGTLVPITGFANSIVAPAMEFKSEGLIMGTAVKMFTIAGPVLVYGITASVFYGLLLYFFGLA
jgi:stage V sporulation protein AC